MDKRRTYKVISETKKVENVKVLIPRGNVIAESEKAILIEFECGENNFWIDKKFIFKQEYGLNLNAYINPEWDYSPSFASVVPNKGKTIINYFSNPLKG